MWPFETKIEPDPAVSTPNPATNYQPPVEEPKPYQKNWGDTLGNLTRFGSAWINLTEIYAIDFETGDGCSCEVTLANGKVMHLDGDSADALQDYIAKH